MGDKDDGKMWGNPLLVPECFQAFHKQAGHDKVQEWLSVKDWIITRERMLMLRKFNEMDPPPQTWGIHTGKINVDEERTTLYVHIEKSSSSTMGDVATSQGLNQTLTIPGKVNHADCGFTVVRNPIDRFVSAYYMINGLLYPRGNSSGIDCVRNLKFWTITTEPERFHAFVDQMTDPSQSWDFIHCGPNVHAISQTQLLSIAQNELQFILKTENLKDQFNSIARLCPNLQELDEFPHANKGSRPTSDPGFYEMMDMVGNERGRPAWKGMDEKTWKKLRDYYAQDFICFGYTPTFQEEVYLAKQN